MINDVVEDGRTLRDCFRHGNRKLVGNHVEVLAMGGAAIEVRTRRRKNRSTVSLLCTDFCNTRVPDSYALLHTHSSVTSGAEVPTRRTTKTVMQ